MKHSFFKVGVSVLTAFALVASPVLGGVPIASADFTDSGDGTHRNPYEISSCADLVQFAGDLNYLNDNFILTQDINCTANGNDVMIGGQDNAFIGTFDGQGNIITVDIEVEGDYVGLFGAVSDDGIVENLGVAGSVIGGENTGAIVGDLRLGGSLLRSFSNASVEGTSSVGGLVGLLRYSSSVLYSYSTGTVVGSGDKVGGVVGFMSDAAMGYSYSTASVTGNNSVGGVLGEINESNVYTPELAFNFGAAEVTALAEENTRVGSVLGSIGAGEEFYIDFNFYDINVGLGPNTCLTYEPEGLVTSDVEGCTGVDTTENAIYFYNESNAPFSLDEETRWNTERSIDIWKFTADDYPTLWAFEDNLGFEGEGSGTSEDPYIIATCEDLENVDNDLYAYYSVEPVGGATEMDCTASGNDIMVRSAISDFKGNFDGNDVNIIVDIDFSKGYVGLFGKMDRATLTDVVVSGNVVAEGENIGGVIGYAEDSTISGSSFSGDVENTADDDLVAGENTGGLAGWIENSVISDSYSTGTVVSATIDVGGFAGDIDESDVSDSYSTANVEGTAYLGGFVGDSDRATFSEIYATGNVTSADDDHIGGLIGDLNEGEVDMSYATGVVTGDGANIGGLIGRLREASSLSNSYATGDVIGRFDTGGLVGLNRGASIENSYSVGAVTGENGLGGLVGFEEEEAVTNHSFWDVQTSGFEDSDGGVGKSTSEMKKIATFTTDLGEDSWDFDTIWGIHSSLNDGYPYLLFEGLEPVETPSRSASGGGSKSNEVKALESAMDYEKEVAEVLARNIVTKDPSSETNKCEALTMMARVFDWNVPSSVTSKYSDVPEWCLSVADFATDRGIVEGRTVTSLGLESPVTRYEVAVMIFRELQKQNYTFSNGIDVVRFSDPIVHWAAMAVNALAKESIIKGFANGAFGGDKGILKQDLGVMLIRI